MGTLAITNAYAYVAARDFTGDINEWRLSGEAEAKDCTNMRSGGFREYKRGVKTSAFEMAGFNDFADNEVDETIWGSLATEDEVITTGSAETEGEPAFFHRAMKASYNLFGPHGEIAPFRVSANGTDGPTGVVRGQLAVKKTTVTTTGAKGTALNLGLVGAGKFLYATFHVFGTPGTTITAVVESDADDTFGSATTRITFGPITAAGGTWGTRVAGAIADDDWFRLRVTAITGTFSIACAVGIGS